jgi:hypothetical protein
MASGLDRLNCTLNMYKPCMPNKTYSHHDITEILLKVALSTIKPNLSGRVRIFHNLGLSFVIIFIFSSEITEANKIKF